MIDPNHSFCTSPFPNVIDQHMTSVDREQIVEIHNYERRLVFGTNMEKMVEFFLSVMNVDSLVSVRIVLER